jgi:hypothetical protein
VHAPSSEANEAAFIRRAPGVWLDPRRIGEIVARSQQSIAPPEKRLAVDATHAFRGVSAASGRRQREHREERT